MNWRLATSRLLITGALLAGGCAPSSKSPPHSPGLSPLVTNVAQSRPASALVLGEQSCASSGCHGAAFEGTARDWHSAYTIWNQEDPHRRSFAVLYSERSVEMYHNLHPETKQFTEPPSDAEYAAFVSQRCLGCHATGLRGRNVVALGDARDVPEYYLSGVTCESCHGPANGWLHTHYLAGFSRTSPGFADTKNPHTLAAQCVGCHIGPMVADNGRAYDMNHDLIAAGHPRLAFELSTYLANYPRHWPEDGRITNVAAWAAGQEQSARQLTRQVLNRLAQAKRSPNESAWPDFSNFDCFDCHHTLRTPEDPRPRPARANSRRGVPRPALLPLASRRLLAQDNRPLEDELSRVQSALTSSWTTPVEDLTLASEDLSLLLAREGEPLVAHRPAIDQRQRHIAVLHGMLASRSTQGPPSFTWDEAVQFHLAVAALVRDLGPAGDELQAANQSLAAALGPQNFASEHPRPYDSPSRFDPQQLLAPLDEIARQLANLSSANETTTARSP
jgi:hypothetical protein